MKTGFRPFGDEYAKDVIDIFNYYIESSFAAFPDQTLPVAAFAMLKSMTKDYPAYVVVDEDDNCRCTGFGFLRAYNPMPAFSTTAAITYFIGNGYTGKGAGKKLLEMLESDALNKGINTILAEISSENPGSINFHKQNGFTECGRFKSIGIKRGKAFDVIWMQKFLPE